MISWLKIIIIIITHQTDYFTFLWSHSSSLKIDVGWCAGGLWKQIGCRDVHALRQVLSTDENCNLPDPKGMQKSTGGSKGFTLSQIKQQTTTK